MWVCGYCSHVNVGPQKPKRPANPTRCDVMAYQLGVKRPGNLVGVCPGAAVAGKGEPFIGEFIQKIHQYWSHGGLCSSNRGALQERHSLLGDL